MGPPEWVNPITALPGQTQRGIDARALLPSRPALDEHRLETQRQLRQAGSSRSSPIQVTPDGVIWDGHHGVRAAAETGSSVDVLVVDESVPAAGPTILQLPVV